MHGQINLRFYVVLNLKFLEKNYTFYKNIGVHVIYVIGRHNSDEMFSVRHYPRSHWTEKNWYKSLKSYIIFKTNFEE